MLEWDTYILTRGCAGLVSRKERNHLLTSWTYQNNRC